MTQVDLIKLAEQKCMKKEIPRFEIGDVVDVHVKIVEGEKERVQIFNGVVIARSGSGTSASFTVRRIVQGEGVERVFPLHAPSVVAVVPKKHTRTRRAKLYYLRERAGKSARLKERRVDTREKAAPTA
ncbi:MAG: 50S ribosomal protein L19 [Planctomycetota bacterium]